MEHDEFLKILEDKFFNNGTFFKTANGTRESVLATIKSLLLKKNLVLISKSELAKLENLAANIPENY